MKTILVSILPWFFNTFVGAFVLFPSLASSAVVYDAAQDFSKAGNPNGVWSYGYSATLGGNMTLYTAHGTMTSCPIDYWWNDLGGGAPFVRHNTSGTTVTNYFSSSYHVYAPGQLSFHPAQAGQFSIIRFTAALSGQYSVTAAFVGIDVKGATTDVHILHNGTSLFDGNVRGFLAPVTGPVSRMVSLQTGDLIDFAVGRGTNNTFNYDSTGISAQITLVSLQAQAIAQVVNGFMVGVSLTYGGVGYTNTPTVRIIGGGGSGAQAVAVVSNGVVVAVNTLAAGAGYTNAPSIVIDPPFIPSPVLAIAPVTLVAFSNLVVGNVYQLQRAEQWYWTNESGSFTATNALYTQMLAGSAPYRLALSPVPAQAFATARVVNGFVVGATVTSRGSGYITNPPVTFSGGGGSNATAVAQVSAGGVTNIAVNSAGIGYTSTPTIMVGQPPAVALYPSVTPAIQLDYSSLVPYGNYQLQITPEIGTAWQNVDGVLATTTNLTISRYLLITDATGLFRLQYLP